MTVYQKDCFNIYRVGTGFIVHNTKLEFERGHTHLKSLKFAKQLVNNVLRKKRPKTKNCYLLESHIRISDSPNYIRLIEELKRERYTENVLHKYK